MKKVWFFCALIALSLQVISCTPQPILETLEYQDTVGEEGNEEENPDGD